MKTFWKSKINFVALAMILSPILQKVNPELVSELLGENRASVVMSIIGMVLFILRTFFTDKKLVAKSSFMLETETEAIPPEKATGGRK